jgi:uncharacterized protein YktA (UPF0223 family)
MEEYIEKYKRYFLITDEKELKIELCKKYLNDTDYAIIKMYETVVQGGSILEMLKEYKEVLSNRKEARQLINELEKSE